MLKINHIEVLYPYFLKANQKICTDTRKIEKGSIFFALKGDNFNANGFAKKAIELGCEYAVIDDEAYFESEQMLLVDDALIALQSLANYHRQQLHIPFLSITGSNGKTTTKELIATVLSKKYKTLATFGNLNNHIGVPLTLLSIKPEHEFAIIEMGANHQGEIEQLSRIAQPDYGLITNIGKAHLEGFGGLEGVKKGKSELYRYIEEKKGKIFIHQDDSTLIDLAKNNSCISYGKSNSCDFIGQDCSKEETVSLKVKSKADQRDWSEIPSIETNIIGNYNFINCLAACAIGSYFGVQEQDIIHALENYHPNMNRSQLIKTKTNTILLDAYNANPNSMKAAIDNFSNLKVENKIALLGDMFELGEYSAMEHQAVIDLLLQKGIENVILVGPMFSATNHLPYKSFSSLQECRDFLIKQTITQSTILIKGSRGMKMETLAEVL